MIVRDALKKAQRLVMVTQALPTRIAFG